MPTPRSFQEHFIIALDFAPIQIAQTRREMAKAVAKGFGALVFLPVGGKVGNLPIATENFIKLKFKIPDPKVYV